VAGDWNDIAMVIDEHGGVDGLLTLNNILQFLVTTPSGASVRAEDATIVQRHLGAVRPPRLEFLGA
jgi:CBS domain containing-hemolysin-like protein